jgi:hypothetical protein
MERGATLSLSPSERLVLLYLSDTANGSKVCWPGQETIVRFTGLALRTVRAVIPALVRYGLIEVESRPGVVTRYHILRSDTPANGHGGNDEHPGNPSQGTPADSARVAHQTPANSIPPPGNPSQGDPGNMSHGDQGDPGKCDTGPRQMVMPTPAKCTPEPKRTKKENQERKEEPPPMSPPSGVGKRGRPLPADWQPHARSLAMGFDLGMSREQIVAEAEAMRDWAAHKGETGHDWDRRFSNWLRESHRRGLRTRPTVQPAKSAIDQIREDWDLPTLLGPIMDDDEPAQRHVRLVS